ncbi:hypothetical protein B5C34_00765 [Pacificimonas flava]|uniref:DUF2333 domain-containing protein n=2 Tax=Pacificimonas TaxID=1960290 RepID=A0A219B1X1_9SPHN|nr:MULTISPECIES: hypothetical protein [Pacificimonas]MBZ6378256.1 hypothetical protein [Pacificimonas aurantium]OWV32123.1 hypothetical protein B5C34_00765 [Pacificimonas flava]
MPLSTLSSLRQRLSGAQADGRPAKTWLGAPRWATALVAIAVLAILYWGVAALIIDDRNADMTLRPAPAALPPGGSVTAAYAATILEREIDRGGWTPNDSFLSPTAGLGRMPAFQRGTVAMVETAVGALSERENEQRLARAAESLSIDPARGVFHGRFPFIGASAGSYYHDAAEDLIAYNTALATGEIVRPDDAETALALVSAVRRSLEAGREGLDAPIRGEDGADEASISYEFIRGQAYAAGLLLRGVRSDFAPNLRERQLISAIVEAIESLDQIATERAAFVGRDDLTAQGYFLSRSIETLGRIETGLARAS